LYQRHVERQMPTSERLLMPDDYDHGRREGLRLALSVLAAEEAKWAALLGQSRSWRTNATREVLAAWRAGARKDLIRT